MRNNANNYHGRTPVQHPTVCQIPRREPKNQGNGERKPNLTFEKNHNNPRMSDSTNLSVSDRVKHDDHDTTQHTWFVPKVSVLIFLCTNLQCSTSLMCIGTLVVTLAACPYLFQLDWLSQSCATTVCVWSCFLTSLRLRCRKISNNGTLSNFV